jgi:hypothetical protein
VAEVDLLGASLGLNNTASPCGLQLPSRPPNIPLSKVDSLGMSFDNPSRKANPEPASSCSTQLQSRCAWYVVAIENQPIALLKTITPVGSLVGMPVSATTSTQNASTQNERLSPEPHASIRTVDGGDSVGVIKTTG